MVKNANKRGLVGWGAAMVLASQLISCGAEAQGVERVPSVNLASLDASQSKQAKTHKDAQSSQKKIDTIYDQKQALVDQYRTTLHEIESLKIYNHQMQRLIASQKDEMQSIATQIKSIEQTHREVVPLMLEMLDTLEVFVSLDLPFLGLERSERLAQLRSMMDRADVSTSEKYRRILEAYQVEGEYGRTIEAYRDTIALEGKELTVDVLRLGRVGLYYQSVDGSNVAMWNQQQKKWDALPSSKRRAITDGLKIARKQAAPDLLVLPIFAAEAS